MMTIYVLTISENGYGKRTPIEEFRPQNRGAKGVVAQGSSDRNGALVAAVVSPELIEPDDNPNLIVATARGQIVRVPTHDVRVCGRNAQGVRIVGIDPGDRVAAAALSNNIDPRSSDILVVTRHGQSIRFGLDQVRRSGLGTKGVKAIDVAEGDAVSSLAILPGEST